MMHEHDDHLMTETDHPTPDKDEHVCVNPDMCSIDRAADHAVTDSGAPDSSPVKKPLFLLPRTWLIGGVVLIVLAVGGVGAFVYSRPATEANVRAVASALPLPAMRIGRELITFKQYYTELDALNHYFAFMEQNGQEAPSAEQLQAMITQTLVNKAVVRKLASDYGVTLDQPSVQAYYDENIVKAYPGETPESVATQLKETFGWTPEAFKKNIVEPVVLSNQVADYISKSSFFQDPMKAEVDAAFDRVSKDPESFEAVGNEVHERVKIDLKSDLGFVSTAELPALWSAQVLALKNGEMTSVIELPQGYAIFRVTDRVKSQESGEQDQDQIHLYAITVPKKTLDQVIADYVQQKSVKTWIKS